MTTSLLRGVVLAVAPLAAVVAQADSARAPDLALPQEPITQLP